MVNLPSQIKSLIDLGKENPELFRVMKKYEPARFIPIDWIIVSQPQNYLDDQVYGIFVVDKEEVRRKLENPSQDYPQVKQDFLVFNKIDNKVRYYRGLMHGEDETDVLQNIYKFCEKYGDDSKYYGCYKRGNRYLTSNHHYFDETDPNLPGEQYVKDNIKEKLNQARREIV